MRKKYEIAGSVMGFFDSFKGSRPAIDNARILIVRSRSRKTIPIDQLDDKLLEIGEQIGGVEIPATSDKIEEILNNGIDSQNLDHLYKLTKIRYMTEEYEEHKDKSIDSFHYMTKSLEDYVKHLANEAQTAEEKELLKEVLQKHSNMF